MNPTAQEIMESSVWKRLTDEIQGDLYDQFTLADSNDAEMLRFIRLQYDAMRGIIRELETQARAELRA
jgi:hypothetical protein